MRSDINEIAYQYFNDLLHEARMKIHDHSLYYGYWFQLENGSEELEKQQTKMKKLTAKIEIYEYILTRLEKI
tara:strand:- start:679 stop:894 length:216 start_codon:yes stop_codon:yes gene_type:complete